MARKRHPFSSHLKPLQYPPPQSHAALKTPPGLQVPDGRHGHSPRKTHAEHRHALLGEAAEVPGTQQDPSPPTLAWNPPWPAQLTPLISAGRREVMGAAGAPCPTWLRPSSLPWPRGCCRRLVVWGRGCRSASALSHTLPLPGCGRAPPSALSPCRARTGHVPLQAPRHRRLWDSTAAHPAKSREGEPKEEEPGPSAAPEPAPRHRTGRVSDQPRDPPPPGALRGMQVDGDFELSRDTGRGRAEDSPTRGLSPGLGRGAPPPVGPNRQEGGR